ncbi:MAG TPA: matrixin family metalloprotease, partial [Thermoanaerobaculia bacterium]|nr:matrixin family metalloprotease [Thermoanaerobaculia bacterium]
MNIVPRVSRAKQTYRRLAIWALSLPLLAGPLSATSYVPMSDEDLVDQAAVAAVVTVQSSEPSPAGIATDYLVEVEEVLKGTVSGSSLVVRVPGVERADGLSLRIWGAPRFAAGSRALVLLAPRADGSYAVQQLMLGAFHEIKAGGKRLALRNLDEAQAIALPGRPQAEPVRDFDRFRVWIAARAGNRKVSAEQADYLVTPPAPAALDSVTSPFTLLQARDLPLRWFQFDGGSGDSLSWRAHNSGQPGFAGGGFAEFQTALAAWNAEPQTPISYVYSGKTGADMGLSDFDGINALLFNDPNAEIAGTFNCASGGVLAIGGPWFDSNLRGPWNGATFIRTAGADIVLNDGIGCFLGTDSKAFQELLAHELGHTLGLGHSSENRNEGNAALRDALMYFSVHDDGRGAALRSDDLAGIRALYKAAAVTRPAAPSNLTAAAEALDRIRLTFRDNSTNESDFVIEQKTLGGTFVETQTVGALPGTGANPSVTVGGLAPATTYVFRVRARNVAGLSSPSNEAAATTFTTPGVCVPGAQALCLSSDRFRVETTWQTADGNSGPGTAVELTADTGYFTFFGSTNVEVVVKVIDGCGLNGNFWVFAGGLSNVQVITRVTDTQTGVIETYTNPQ